MQCVIKTQYQKQKLFLNNFQAGHLLDASGKRTIFSSQGRLFSELLEDECPFLLFKSKGENKKWQ